MERRKTFFNEQCIKLEEKNRRGKTRYLQENWRYQGNILPQDGHDKEQTTETW